MSCRHRSDTSDEQRPMRRSLLTTLRRNFHWKCFFLTLTINACVAVTVWCQISYAASPATGTSQNSVKGPCDQGYSFIPIAFGIMLYVVYLMECWHCRTRMDLSNKVDISDVYEATKKFRASMPVVWWRAVCYHYVRRTRYRNGDAVTTTQVYYERMNSHTASSVFLYHDCGVKDISKNLVDLDKFPVTKVRFSKGFVFANIQAANEFEEQRARFFQENEQRDDYMEVREGLDLINEPFKEYLIAFTSPNKLPFYASHLAFWSLSMLLMSWFIRVLVEYKTAYVHYQVTKLFGTNYLSPTNQHYTGPFTAGDHSETRDPDSSSAALQNYFIVPSYSEALLMDPVGRDGNGARNGVHLSSRQPQRLHHGGSQGTLCNEAVMIPNYGALTREAGLSLVIENQRSRSMTFFRPRSDSQSVDHQNGGQNRSFSFSSLVAMGRGNNAGATAAYRALPATPEDCSTASTGEEPPPPYEIALQMCRPLYAKIKRSLSSLDKFRLHRNTNTTGSSSGCSTEKNGTTTSGYDTPL